jgi:hypothetical protein
MSTRDNLQSILDTADSGTGMDVIIVSTTSADQAAYWQRRLEAGRGQICRHDAQILAIHEDWPGGAGNGLGTLYAVREAARLARDRHAIDLAARLEDGASIGLYHTAGKGTRLAPLPGSEGGNKPAVKLPGLVPLADRVEPLTILEAVIRQTAVYAPLRRGRLSVFWGDQVFIPSAPSPGRPRHHVDILAKLGGMPDAAAWRRDGLDRYGLVAVGPGGDAVQVEKVSHTAAVALLDAGVMRVDGGIGVSLGSFSLSAAMLAALDAEFAPELVARTAKLDTDPHFWMPMTLPEPVYLEMMAAKGEPAARSRAHYRRLADFVAGFRGARAGEPLFGCVDVGADCYWWDYGTLANYRASVRRLLDDDQEAGAMRAFFASPAAGAAEFRDGNLLIDCRIGGGSIRSSVLVGVTAGHLDVDGAVLVNVVAPAIAGRDLVLYNVFETTDLAPAPGSVRADTYLPDGGRVSMWTRLDRDGKDDWETVLPGNALSHAQLCELNATLTLDAAAESARRHRLLAVAMVEGDG